MANPKQRIRIFDNWQIRQPQLEAEPMAIRSGDVVRAEDLVNQSELFIANIQEFLASKDKYLFQCQQEKKRVEILLETLHIEGNYQSEVEQENTNNIKKFKANLKLLYLRLRQSKILQDKLEMYFQSANLANYDRSVMQLNFTKTPQEMSHQLNLRINQLRESMHSVIQAQRLKETGKTLSSIFGKQKSLEYCTDSLQQKLSHDRLVEIHYLMLYQLQELQNQIDLFKASIKMAEGEYQKYEVIYDCLMLMTIQTLEMDNQMKSMREEIETSCTNSNEVDLPYYQSTSQNRLTNSNHNILIYQANLENFNRVNVETNMFYYTELKAIFIKKLQQFTDGLGQYSFSRKNLLFLLERQSLFRDIDRRTEITHKVTESDKKLVLNLYNECSNIEISRYIKSSPNMLQKNSQPSKNPMFKYKESLLEKMQVFLVNNNIAYNKNARMAIQSDADLTKFKQFFEKIHKIPTSAQYQYVSSQKNAIRAYSYELQNLKEQQKNGQIKDIKSSNIQLNQNKLKNLRSYQLSLKYSQVMASQDSLEQKLVQFEAIKKQYGFEDMPIKFQNLIFNYINDIKIIQQSIEQEPQLVKQLSILQKKLETVTKSKVKANMDNLIQSELSNYQVIWLQFYHKYLRRVSHYGNQLILDRLGWLCEYIKRSIDKAFPQDVKVINSKTMNVDKKLFFTFKTLVELNSIVDQYKNQTQSFKIVNLNPVLQEVFATLDNNFITKGISGKICQIIKLYLLQKYFGKIYKQKNYENVIKMIRLTAYLQSISELYPFSGLSDNQILQPLLKIQIKMNNIVPVLNKQEKSTIYLQQKASLLIKQIRKFPFTIAAKHNFLIFEHIFRYNEILKQIREMLNQPLTIWMISKGYVNVMELKETLKTGQINFDSYENLVLKEKKSIERYFEKERLSFIPFTKSYEKELEQIIRNYLNKDEIVNLQRSLQILCKYAQQKIPN